MTLTGLDSRDYGAILADPPWPYKDSLPGKGRGAGKYYDLMSVESICALPVGAHGAESSHLYLWCTNSFIEQAHQVARAWGYDPKTILTWVKANPETYKIQIGMGWYFRNATEHVLFATRNNLRTKNKGTSNVFIHSRSGLEHSQKPDAFYDLVESMSPGPYLEVFARREYPGWDVWGKEV